MKVLGVKSNESEYRITLFFESDKFGDFEVEI
jgi:hypothetical protein